MARRPRRPTGAPPLPHPGAGPAPDAGSEGEVVVELPDDVWAVLDVVEAIPRGRVRTYGDVGAAVGRGPRFAGRVMGRYGHLVPWWRVVNAAGTLPDHLTARAVDRWAEEGTPRRASGAIDLAIARLPPPAG